MLIPLYGVFLKNSSDLELNRLLILQIFNVILAFTRHLYMILMSRRKP